jgi:hypothetical protein
MKQSAVEWLVEAIQTQFNEGFVFNPRKEPYIVNKAKEKEEKNLLEMLHKFGFDYTYNYRGEKTIYEWIPEWFEEYKRLEQFKNK